MTSLTEETLTQLNADVSLPRYDRRHVKTGIVHIGVGNFHRAHQATVGGAAVTSMRRVVVYPGRIAVEAAEVPAPHPNEALVRTLMAGVCGSDLHAAHGRHPFVPLPYRPGHEVVGVVETAGSAVEAFTPGQRVIVEPDLPCWTCKMCTSGRESSARTRISPNASEPAPWAPIRPSTPAHPTSPGR
jgi:Zn-dependent alcohol dehydrogenase